MKAILVVDDDADVRLFCQDLLKYWGYVVHGSATGEEALILLSTLEIQAMLLDLHLPGLSGSDVLRLAREEGFQFPVLLMSASHPEEPSGLLKPGGAQGFLSKPFGGIELEHWVKQWVGAP